MKRGVRSLVGAALLACLAPFAQAGLIIDHIDVSELIGAGGTKTVTHDVSGQISAAEDAVAGILFLLFADDLDAATETAQIDFGSTTNTSQPAWIDLKVFGVDTQALAGINADGTLAITVKSLAGDFFWKSSTLALLTGPAQDAGGSGVPEPGTLSLLGLMLVGLGLARRAKFA